jgi:uncharacterized Fe-S center protein
MGESYRMNKIIFITDMIKFDEALDYFNIQGFRGKTVPIKLHMGELKNKYFPNPELVKNIVSSLKNWDINSYLLDTTVAYPGSRHSKQGYEQVAQTHGFTLENVGCTVVIDDNGKPVTVEGRTYEVATHLQEASHIFSLSHVKGHIATGMGGAIKNFGMGGVTKETKRRMHHGSRPVHHPDKCTHCGVCAELCPFDAININGNHWERDKRNCFGCGVCVDVCQNQSLSYEDADLQYVLACAAKACVENKNVIYMNELKRIARSCDCDPQAGPVICPDIGYLLGIDPVAIDKASLDLINDVKEDVFIKENKIDPIKQIRYGEEIGLGSSTYQLIEI